MKKYPTTLIIIIFFSLLGCNDASQHKNVTKKSIDNDSTILTEPKVQTNNTSNKLRDRILVPKNYKRAPYAKTSFGYYLQNLKLKPEGSLVKYYNGSTKSKAGVYHAVIDLDIGDKDLHQCADAVMRLRAEYLWKEARYDDIKFNFTNGHQVAYSEWMKGKRMQVKGNKTNWIQKTSASNTYEDLWNYLELIFMYAGTSSLEKEMKTIRLSEVKVGDVLIQGGFPGHAVIVVDEAIHSTSGKKIFMLAQSYMPAQHLQILMNPNDKELSPWYEFMDGEIATPEWGFNASDFRSF